MIYKLTSCKTVIAKAQMSFQLQGSNWQGWAVEWIGDALKGIGNSAGILNKDKPLKVKNHKVAIPCDLINLTHIEYNGQRLKYGNNTRSNEFTLLSLEGGFPSEYPLDSNVGDSKVETENVKIQTVRYIEQEYYQLYGDDYITTSFEEGTIKIFYEAYPTDDEGFPLVPDTFAHLEALQYFILFKLCSGGYKHAVWDVKSALSMWNDYKAKASNKAIYPSIDKMDAFNNMWVRQVRDVFSPDKFFNDSQQMQSITGI